MGGGGDDFRNYSTECFGDGCDWVGSEFDEIRVWI